jgi:hypothetical protein
MSKLTLFLFATIFATGCASTLGYRPAGGGYVIGYTDTKLTTNSYRVKYVGGEGKTYALFLRRAAELTLSSGHSHFIVKDGTSADLHRGYVQGVAMNLPQYEATVVMLKAPTAEAVDAKEVLSTQVASHE